MTCSKCGKPLRAFASRGKCAGCGHWFCGDCLAWHGGKSFCPGCGSRAPRGVTLVELLTVVGVLGVLVSIGYGAVMPARQGAKVTVAQARLRQIATGLELYFLQYRSYPPQGSGLAAALRPFVSDPKVFENPLANEAVPGGTLDVLYRQPSPDEIDSPNHYVTAFVTQDTSTSVVLYTGGIVMRQDNLAYRPSDPGTLVAMLSGQASQGGFDVTTGGDVVARTDCDVRILVVGSQFGYANGQLVNMVAAADIGTGMTPLFGNKPVHGGETYTQANVKAGTRVTLKAGIADPAVRAQWGKNGFPTSYTSNDGTGQVVVLRNGDKPINNHPAFPCQVGVNTLLAPYVDSKGLISIASNEALYCFDFNPLRTRKGIDYNDVVILATALAATRP